MVGLLRQRLADLDVARRNRLRAWEFRLQTVIDRHHADAAGADRQARAATLRKNRDDILGGRRLSTSERTTALRSQIQQARLQLTDFANNRCTSVRTELREDASSMSRRRLGEFKQYVRLKGMGVEFIELCTSDTHNFAARSLTDRGYFALGEDTSFDTIIDCVRRLLVLAGDRVAPCNFEATSFDTEIPLIGHESLDDFAVLTKDAISSTTGYMKVMLPAIFVLFVITLFY